MRVLKYKIDGHRVELDVREISQYVNEAYCYNIPDEMFENKKSCYLIYGSVDGRDAGCKLRPDTCNYHSEECSQEVAEEILRDFIAKHGDSIPEKEDFESIVYYSEHGGVKKYKLSELLERTKIKIFYRGNWEDVYYIKYKGLHERYINGNFTLLGIYDSQEEAEYARYEIMLKDVIRSGIEFFDTEREALENDL